MIWLEKYKTIIITGIVAVLAVFLFISKPKDEMAAGNELQVLMEEQPDADFQKEEREEKAGPVLVDVKGAVPVPGLYKMEEGDRVLDAIEQAGGLLDAADEKQVNFAQKVYDEMVIYIPKKGEPMEDIPQMAITPSVGQGNGNGMVNINKADLSELQTLSGIGPAKAQAIIDYREQDGPFKQAEDLKNVSGIGEKTFEKLQESISVN
ncbi:membrane bound high-affinity DNA-binding receptor [Bacillus freudenreichii]|nr:membrane bound high-affinity DNA-binding receptor [Bacillus freudenreichii]